MPTPTFDRRDHALTDHTMLEGLKAVTPKNVGLMTPALLARIEALEREVAVLKASGVT